MKKKTKWVYLSGKVTGKPWIEAQKDFCRAAEIVKAKGGRECLIPIYICDPKWDWFKCMHTCITAMLLCDEVAMLPDWKKSRGAKIEWLVAKACGMPVQYLKSCNR